MVSQSIVAEEEDDSEEGRQTDARKRTWSKLRGGNVRERRETRRASKTSRGGERSGEERAGFWTKQRERKREREREQERV